MVTPPKGARAGRHARSFKGYELSAASLVSLSRPGRRPKGSWVSKHDDPSDLDDDKAGEEMGERLEKVVRTIAISPADAKDLVDKYRRRFHYDGSERSKLRIAKAIVQRYARWSGLVGGATAVPGVVPGVGAAVAVVGGGLADAALSVKLQVDMCLCLAELYQDELPSEDKVALAMIIALSASVEKLAAGPGVKLVEGAIVRTILAYLRGPALIAVKQLFKKIGIVFVRASLVKAVPFGVGIALGTGANYGLTLIVGRIAIRFFEEVPDPLGRSQQLEPNEDAAVVEE